MQTRVLLSLPLVCALSLTQPAQAFRVDHETVAEHPSGLLGMDLALDRVGRPYLLYHEGPVAHLQWFARQEGPERTWARYLLNAGGASEVVLGEGAAVDELFNEHILLDVWPQSDWYPFYPHSLRYGRRVGSQPWSWSTVGTRETRDFARLVLFRETAAVTQPWICWVDGNQLRRARPSPGGWESTTVLQYGSARLRILDLQVDARGNTHLLYLMDDYPDRNLKYARRGPDQERTVALRAAPEMSEYGGLLALDSHGRPQVLYHEVTGNWHYLLYLRCVDDQVTAWQEEEPPPSHCTDEWFALDRFDEPMVVSRREPTGALFLGYRQSGVWRELVMEEDRVDRKVGMRLDSLDRVLAGYRVLGAIRVASALPNQSPVLTQGASIGPLVAGHPAGAAHVRTVTQLVNGAATDPDGTTWGGMGIALLAGTQGGLWDYSLDGGASWTSLAFLNHWVEIGLTDLAYPLPPSASLRFRPWANFTGSIPNALRYCAWDQFRGTAGEALELPEPRRGGASGFSAETQSIAVTVDPYRNTAPVLVAPVSVELDPVAMNADDGSNPGTLVADLLERVTASDAEGDPIGIAITGGDTAHGSWQFKAAAGAWTELVALPEQAQLLQPADHVRFRPEPGYEGAGPGITFRAWDQTSSGVDTRVNGGSSAFSALQVTAEVAVVAPNHAPVLTMPEPFMLPTVYYNQPDTTPATLVADLIAGRWSDPDGQVCGVAIAEARGRDVGTWEVELPGSGVWRAFPNWLVGYAYLLPPGARVRFTPDAPGERDLNPALRFHAWDQFRGTAGTAVPIWSRGGYTSVSPSAGTARLELRFRNTAPPEVLPSQEVTLTLVEDIAPAANEGIRVADVLAGRASDADGNVLGGAIGYYLHQHGTWQYRLASDTEWRPVQWPSNLGRRLMLSPESRIRFAPDPNWNGTVAPPTLRLHAWDQTWGTNGVAVVPQLPSGVVSPFSDRYIDFRAQVNPVPDAPVIAAEASFQLLLELGGLQPAVVKVSDLIRDKITDADGDVCGIAVYSANHAGGRWEFSEADPDTGATLWVDLGELASPWVWLLAPDRSLRFVADGPLPQTLEQGLFIRGWDQTTGEEGRTNEVGFAGGATGLSKEWDWVSVRQRNLEFCTVADPGNAWDAPNNRGQRLGAINYVFRAGKYEVSNREYCVFLNAVARIDPFELYPSYLVGGVPYGLRGIERLGAPGEYTYRCFPGREDLPMCFLSYYSTLRYVNWLHNGGGNGSTEDGAYTLLGGTPTPSNSSSILRNPGARFWLLSEDEWYKAAFYKGGGPDAGYWEYAVQSDEVPITGRPPGGPHTINCTTVGWLASPTPVGAYFEAVSAYGTHDQNGNVQEWLETPGAGATAALRGSTFDWTTEAGAASTPTAYYGVQSWLNIGFRIGARAVFESNAAPVLQFEGDYVVSYDLGPVQRGSRVVELLGDLVHDLEGDLCGMAILGVDRRYGEWQYGTTDPASGIITWYSLGSPTPDAALLIGPEARLRFIPNPDTYPGGSVPGVTFRAWDRRAGDEFSWADATDNGGETPFSAAVRTLLGRSNVVVVGDPGNAADVPDTDQRRHGAVGYVFRIGKYEVSNREYCAFLNAVARSDSLGLYPSYMVGGQPYTLRGIEQLGEPGAYTYRCFAGREDLPTCYIPYHAALRYANWLHHGGGSGDTEVGAYTLLGGTPIPGNRDPIARNPGAQVWLPSEDEWYKAAYYRGGGPDAGYWEFAVQTDEPPVAEPPPGGPHSVNCASMPTPVPNPVGAYPQAVSAYGTHDQTGNLEEWLESTGAAGAALLRGGQFGWGASDATASRVARSYGVQAYFDIGFRIAAVEAVTSPPPPIPPPASPAPGEPLVIAWPTDPGWWYQLQEIADLGQVASPEHWTNYGHPIRGNGAMVSRDVALETANGLEGLGRFFRILVLPP